MKDFICNQTKIPREQWRYGFRSSAAVGCGWIATYNALRLMGYSVDPQDLIRYYERSLPLLNGTFGTFMPEPARFFKLQGFPVRIIVKRDDFDNALQVCDAGILFYFWQQKGRIGSHYVAVRYEKGNVVSFNTFRNSDGPDQCGSSLSAFAAKQRWRFPVLIAICKKPHEA